MQMLSIEKPRTLAQENNCLIHGGEWLEDGVAETVLQDILWQGYSVQHGIIARDIQTGLRKEILDAFFEKPGIETKNEGSTHPSSSIHWMEEDNVTIFQNRYIQLMKNFRDALNQSLEFELVNYTGHLAMYPPGAGYVCHIDSDDAHKERLLTCILYLNERWTDEDGGQLRLYTGQSEYIDVLPEMGTFVVFLSRVFWHEVLPTKRQRLCIPGWLNGNK